MKQCNRLVLAVSKLLEVAYWLATAAAVVGLIGCFAAKDFFTSHLPVGTELTIGSLELAVFTSDGTYPIAAAVLLSITAILSFTLMAMIFRNVYLSLKTSDGKTWFATGKTPFQSDVTRMVREIGIFYLAITVIAMVMAVLARLILGHDFVELHVNLQGIITGIIILCLSQVFSLGTSLQKDVDGLL